MTFQRDTSRQQLKNSNLRQLLESNMRICISHIQEHMYVSKSGVPPVEMGACGTGVLVLFSARTEPKHSLATDALIIDVISHS